MTVATLLLRLPDDLKERLRLRAFEQRESQNAFVVQAIEEKLERERAGGAR